MCSFGRGTGLALGFTNIITALKELYLNMGDTDGFVATSYRPAVIGATYMNSIHILVYVNGNAQGLDPLQRFVLVGKSVKYPSSFWAVITQGGVYGDIYHADMQYCNIVDEETSTG